MIQSAHEIQKIETCPEAVNKAISPESDIHKSSLDRRLDQIFDEFISSVNYQEQKRSDSNYVVNYVEKIDTQSIPLQSNCSHGNSSAKQNQGKGKSWKRAFVETLIWFLFVTILP